MTTTAPQADIESRRSARSGAIGLLGAAVNGACGFVLTAVIVRVFGPADAGAFFSVIGLVSIVGPLCCLGADTGLLWALPRRTLGAAGDAAPLLPVALLPTVALALVVGVTGWFGAPMVAEVLLDGAPDSVTLVRLAFAGVPVFVTATVLLSGVRGTRTVGAYVGLQLIAVPIARPLLIGGAAVGAGSVVLGFAGWLLPLAVAAVVALLLLAGPLGLFRGATLRAPAADRRLFWSFALPRALSTAIDASSMWVGVLLTSALAGRVEAGIFGAVGRYALAGLLIMQGLRVAVAPQLSRLLGAERRPEAAKVYRRTTLWIVLLSCPAYLLLAAFSPAFLTLFGTGFAGGSAPMAVLAGAMLVNVGVGLVQTVLLMSGNSRGHLLATVSGLALNVTLCVVLIPRHGALGAAIAWSLGIVCENVIAAGLARRALGEPLFGRALVGAAIAVATATGFAAGVGILVCGRGLAGLGAALVVLLFGAIVSLGSGRVRLALKDIRADLRPAATQETPG
ncbi:polysaccharide biosynthesis C-terminal domain-containing protein [Actinoplanes sp. NPDC026623]|uniref:lipopolysaccharide biosynthesis protein n=1 Tax=Actinoplanes sp. NPDC026623 TaxID=3155610 RepID=UPI0033EC76C3